VGRTAVREGRLVSLDHDYDPPRARPNAITLARANLAVAQAKHTSAIEALSLEATEAAIADCVATAMALASVKRELRRLIRPTQYPVATFGAPKGIDDDK
jgi:hypothetical protein